MQGMIFIKYVQCIFCPFIGSTILLTLYKRTSFEGGFIAWTENEVVYLNWNLDKEPVDILYINWVCICNNSL